MYPFLFPQVLFFSPLVPPPWNNTEEHLLQRRGYLRRSLWPAKWGAVLTGQSHQVDPFTINTQLSGFCNSGNAGEFREWLWLRTDKVEGQGHKGSWWAHGIQWMNIWYIVKSRISKVGSREDGLIELGRSENWGRDGAQSKGKCRRVKTKKKVKEGGINMSDVEFNQLVSTRPGLKGHRKMKMGIFQHICTIECTCQITCPGVEGKFYHVYTFAFYCCRVIFDRLVQIPSVSMSYLLHKL